MNASDSSSSFITRRDFMKKSALTVGAITLLSQGIGLAADGCSSDRWVMLCGSPAIDDESHEWIVDGEDLELTNDITATEISLILESTKYQDPPGTWPGYNSCAYSVLASFRLETAEAGMTLGFWEDFLVTCNPANGALDWELGDHNPAAELDLAANYVLKGRLEIGEDVVACMYLVLQPTAATLGAAARTLELKTIANGVIDVMDTSTGPLPDPDENVALTFYGATSLNHIEVPFTPPDQAGLNTVDMIHKFQSHLVV